MSETTAKQECKYFLEINLGLAGRVLSEVNKTMEGFGFKERLVSWNPLIVFVREEPLTDEEIAKLIEATVKTYEANPIEGVTITAEALRIRRFQ